MKTKLDCNKSTLGGRKNNAMSELNTSLRNGLVKFDYDFNSVAEVTHVWGLKAKRLPYSVSFKIPGVENTIAILLSENGGRGWKNIPHRGTHISSRGHRQIERIDEVNADHKISADRCREELEKPLTRYVFWRESLNGVQWYKFHGVFKVDANATRASLANGDNICIYTKIADECTCPKADWHLAEISDGEFVGYANRVVEAVLQDEIDYRIDNPKATAGSVKAWPGQKLLVSEVVRGGVKVVCSTADENLLASVKRAADEFDAKVEFFIPKRDFELGYFRVLPGEAKLEDTFAEKDDDDLAEEK